MGKCKIQLKRNLFLVEVSFLSRIYKKYGKTVMQNGISSKSGKIA
jgi:hypothetical protein